MTSFGSAAAAFIVATAFYTQTPSAIEFSAEDVGVEQVGQLMIHKSQYAREDVRRGSRYDQPSDVKRLGREGLTFDQIQTLQQSLRDQQLSSVPRDIRDRRSVIGQ